MTHQSVATAPEKQKSATHFKFTATAPLFQLTLRLNNGAAECLEHLDTESLSVALSLLQIFRYTPPVSRGMGRK